jgi:hypothetical protein
MHVAQSGIFALGTGSHSYNEPEPSMHRMLSFHLPFGRLSSRHRAPFLLSFSQQAAADPALVA